MPFNGLVRQRLQPLSSAFTSNRILLYALASTVATLATVVNASQQHSNFYSVTVYLSRSGQSLLVLANFGFLTALLSGRILQRVFFGALQPRETERLYDQTWMFVTESLLAFTIFRDDFDIPFVVMFGFLLFIKCFHWLMADRVESMDQIPYPGPPLLFHARINSLFVVLWLVDFCMLAFAIESTLENGVGGMVLFASEYAILMAGLLNSMSRYILSNWEIRRAGLRGGENAPPWENKSMYIFYIELVTDFLKLATYLAFFLVVLTFYGLPLNIIRDVYLTARSFITRLRALVRYHNATRDMDRRYPNATEEELAATSDRTCIICREEMVAATNQGTQANENVQNPPNVANNTQDGPNVTPKKLPCGHIFHFQCLRSWLERQQSCPTCRRTVLETDQPNRNNQAPARGGRPAAAPQPGAQPQAQPGAAGARGLGFLGRILGAAAQPPLVPGQFPNAQAPNPNVPPPAQPFPQQMPVNAGWGPQVPPPGYGYQYAYQPIPPQQLQPPPVFRGFYGPGMAWQNWGAEAQQVAQGQQARQPQTAPRTQPPSGTSDHTPTPTVPSGSVPSPQTAEANSESSGETSAASSSSEQATTPRNAAALAALRRFNSSRPNAPQSDAQPPPMSTTGTSSESASSVSSSTATPSESVSSTPQSPTSLSAPISPEARHDTLPGLIPLYDLGPNSLATGGTQGSLPPVPPYFAPSLYARPPTVNPRTYPQYQSGYPLPPQGFQQPPPGYNPRHPHRSSASRAPISRLPPTLTDEQLGRLDRLTRDAIDERLRVLEGVSGAVYRCIEELTRIRSVLPPAANAAGEASTSRPNGPPASTQNEAPSQTDGNANGDAVDKGVSVGISSGSSAQSSSSGSRVTERSMSPYDVVEESAADPL